MLSGRSYPDLALDFTLFPGLGVSAVQAILHDCQLKGLPEGKCDPYLNYSQLARSLHILIQCEDKVNGSGLPVDNNLLPLL
jgi:hypothetical protein